MLCSHLYIGFPLQAHSDCQQKPFPWNYMTKATRQFTHDSLPLQDKQESSLFWISSFGVFPYSVYLLNWVRQDKAPFALTQVTHWETCSAQFSRSVLPDSLRPHESQHARPPCSSPSPGVPSDSHPSSLEVNPAISSSVVPFSSCLQSLPASESFPMSQLFTWGGQSTGVSASASFLPKKSQHWSPLEWTGWISLQPKGLSRVFSNTVQKHQFFIAQPSSQSNSHIHTWLLEKP